MGDKASNIKFLLEQLAEVASENNRWFEIDTWQAQVLLDYIKELEASAKSAENQDYEAG